MVLVFDLDDTLYMEITYVKSGFSVVSKMLAPVVQLPSSYIMEKLCAIEAQHGRGKVFDSFLLEVNCYSTKLVNECVKTYRLHMPNITLNSDATRCLQRFKDFPKYVVTDGNKVVQYKKVRALNLERSFKKVFVTHQYGLKYAKPSPFCFNTIARIEKTDPKNVIYIADNPNKDFVGIKPLGFKTIRIRQGMFQHIDVGVDKGAHMEIFSLDELELKTLETLK